MHNVKKIETETEREMKRERGGGEGACKGAH